jgi:2-dehydropantoate 2-reductase
MADVAIYVSLQDRISIGIHRRDGMCTGINTPEETAILSKISSILEAGGSTVKIVPDIHREKFIKNLWNVGFSSVATLTGYRLPSIFRAPPTESQAKYSPYVCAKTAHLVTSETIPAIRAVVNEMIALGEVQAWLCSIFVLNSEI